VANSYSLFRIAGKVGEWKDMFTVAQSEIVDEVYGRKMKGSKLEISFE
jgi:hypothetical protein